MKQKSVAVFFKFLSLIVIGMLLQLSAKASTSCLTQVSNLELVDELQRRLNSSAPIDNSGNALTATCSSGSLILRIVNLSSGSLSDNFSTYIGLAETCLRLVDSLIAVTDRSFSKAFIISTCESSSLVKTSVNDSGQFKRISSDYIGNTETCLAQAIEANRRLKVR